MDHEEPADLPAADGARLRVDRLTAPVDELLRDHRGLHSPLQIDAWILTRDNWTPYGMYQQALRELHGRRAAVIALRREIDLAELDLLDLHRRRPWWGALRKRRHAIRTAELQEKLRGLFAALGEHVRELDHFHAAAARLKAEVGELTPERREQLDREAWGARIRMMAALDVATNGRVGRSVLEMLAAAPADLRRALLAEIREPARLLALIDS